MIVDVDLKKELAAGVVRAWYEGVPGVARTPSYREAAQALELIEREGEDDVLAALPVLIETMRRSWPDAVRWGAAEAYWPQALRQVRAARQQQRRRATEDARRRQHSQEHAGRREVERTLEDVWGPAWEQLPNRERGEIERRVLAAHPFAGTIPSFLYQLCLREFAGAKS